MRVAIFGLGLVLATTACKDKLEDLPDVDPVDDPWVDAIEAEEAGAVEDPVAVEPTIEELAEAGAEPVADTEGEIAADTEGDPAEAEGDPDGAGGTQLAAANTGGSGASKSGSGSGGSGSAKAAEPTPEPKPEDEPEAAAAPTAPEPVPVAEPKPKPEPKPAPPPPITMADYDGTWGYSGGASQRQKLAEAIEFGANQVASIIRGIARKRLTKTQIIEDPVEITIAGNKATFKWGTTGDGMVVEIDGPTTTMKYQGDKYKVRARAKDGKLITIFQAPDATKTIVYTMTSDRKRMTAHHKLVADQLDTPVTFKISYSRK